MAERKVVKRGTSASKSTTRSTSTKAVKTDVTSTIETPKTPVDNTEENSALKENDVEIIRGSIGDPSCYIYYACHFTSLRRDADLISIALVDSDNHTFYAEFNDYDISKASDYTFRNVIKKLTKPLTNLEGDHWTMTGTRKEIRTQLFFWLDKMVVQKSGGVQFVGDCPWYSFVLLSDLILGCDENNETDATALPTWVSRVCVDINQDIAMMLHRTKPVEIPIEVFNKNYIPYVDAFSLERKSLIEAIDKKLADEYDVSSSLLIARGIRAIHRNIWGIELPE